MAFDYTTLITDRTAADVARVKALAAKGWAAMTAEEQAEWDAEMKGAYNAGDMNRVSACMEDLAARFRALGYHVPGYERVEVQRNASRLPEGYTEVEYIESSGTQYVDTGVAPTTTLETKIVLVLTTEETSEHAIFGSAWSASGYFLVAYSGKFRWHSRGAYVDTTTGIDLAKKLAISASPTGLAVNGSSYSLGGTGTDTANSIYLFHTGDNATYGSKGKFKLYSCQIYDNGTLVRDFVPCIDADGAVGLYDLATDEFYGNAGTGTFTAGDAVATASDTDDLDSYTWYETDAPTESEAAQYLSNVAAVRRVVAQAATTPATPASMVGLTVDTANDIETILADTDRLVTNISKAWYYSGEAYAGEI